ncbi:hypothetical protein CPC08DRAFT_624453 [Agrocybe pediades]|nr:hypothetical protein CPC08DRAFT_624453 [Agrocybe pediades]
MKANIAFVHDPIFIETRPKSYLLDYGRIQRNQEIEQYIDRYKKFSPVFHVFTFPEKKSDWFYVGAHNLRVVVLQDSFWPLEGKDKMLSKLSKRSRGGISEVEMGRLLDSGELQQFCVELTGIQDDTSLDFASNKLGRRSTGQLGEVRHERRAEGVKE